jgi:hypothetical protein
MPTNDDGVAEVVRIGASSTAPCAAAAWLLWSPCRSAGDDLPDTRDESEPRSQLLLGRLEPEAASASHGPCLVLPPRSIAGAWLASTSKHTPYYAFPRSGGISPRSSSSLLRFRRSGEAPIALFGFQRRHQRFRSG